MTLSRLLLCLGAFAGATLVTARAQSIAYEPFNYTVGGNLAGNTLAVGNTWGTQNSGTPPSIASGNLTVTGLAASSGNMVSFPGGNFQEAVLSYPSASTGSVYFSFAFTLSSQPTATTYSFGLNNGTNFAATIWLQASGAGYVIGLGNRSSGVTPVYDSTVQALNQTVFLVASLDIVAGTANDVSSLWINPSSATFAAGTAPTATLTSSGGADIGSVNSFLIRGATGSPAGSLDELRIGTTWASVTPAASAVPEPSTYAALLGVFVLGGAIWRRARRAA